MKFQNQSENKKNEIWKNKEEIFSKRRL